jgi:putative flippase GtrA
MGLNSAVLHRRSLIKMLWRRLTAIEILCFMFVGGIGYIVNIAVFWLLYNYTIHGLYLIDFLLSSNLAILCNYTLNKRWTFRRYPEKSIGMLRYFSMAYMTLCLDMFMLYLFVDFGHIHPIVAATFIIAGVSVLRFTIARRWIWNAR